MIHLFDPFKTSSVSCTCWTGTYLRDEQSWVVYAEDYTQVSLSVAVEPVMDTTSPELSITPGG